MQATQIYIQNTTVHASAGSGKTYLLVSRIIQLLLNGAEPGSILAITFTRKAAAEMQERLLSRLFELASIADNKLSSALIALGATDTEQTRQLARQLYERILNTEFPVTTTTFHAFCQDLLRRFPLEADVPAGFDLVEHVGHIQDEAWEALMAEAAAYPDGALAIALDRLFQQLSLFNTRQALVNFVHQRSDWWAYTQGEAEPLAFAAQRLQQQLAIEQDADPLFEFMNNPELIKNIQKYIDYLGQRDLKTNQKSAAELEKGLDDRYHPAERYQTIRNAFITQKGTVRSLKPSATMDKAYGKQGAEDFIALHQQCAEDILNTDQILAAHHTWQITTDWYRAGEHLLSHYQTIKQQQRLLDFTDLEWKSFQLLNHSDNASWVQYKLDNRIKHLLVDEFQDTNPTQWQLLLPLLKEFASDTDRKTNSVFLVGDAKQSIYRFRRAEPRLFNTASEWLEAHMQAGRQPLNKSWRSSPAIIDFVNRLFSEGELHDQLPEFMQHETVHDSLWGSVTLLPLVQPDEQEEETTTELRNPLHSPRVLSNSDRLTEGELVARTIQQLVDEGIPVGDADQARPVRFSDVLILLRSRTHVGEFEHTLRQFKIPYLGAERGTLLEALEILDMVKLLQWLLSPYDNHALASILRSPLFNVSDNDLLLLAGKGTGNWFDRLMGLQDELPEDATLCYACSLLTGWSELAGKLPVHDLLDRIYSDANVLACYTSAFPDNLKSRVSSNLTRFLELALESDSGRYPSLSRFITWLNDLKLQATESPDEPPGEGQADRVRLLTIHEAKGLEAPIVFLVDSARPLQKKSAYAALVDWADSQQRPETFLLTGRKDQLDSYSEQRLAQQSELEDREEINLLYVAVTRAQQHLYVSGTRGARSNDKSWYDAICRQYELVADDLTEASQLQQSGQPVKSPSQLKQTDDVPIKVDDRLCSTIRYKNLTREIAPSRRTKQPSLSHTELDEDARQRGIMIHRMLELLSSHEDISDKNLAQNLELPESSVHFQEYLLEARSIITAPHLKQLFDNDQYQESFNEVPLTYEVNGQIVYGIIDRLIVNQDRVLLIDYKTHRAAADHYQELSEVYRPQLEYYVEGIKRLWPDREVVAQLLFTHSATLLPLAI